jgi:hypothetical protein
MRRYIPGDLLDEAKQAIRSHVPIGDVARRLGIEVEDLRHRLDLPSGKLSQEPTTDLWRSDELQERL